MDIQKGTEKIPLLLVGQKIPIFLDEPMARAVKEPTEWNQKYFSTVDEASRRLYDAVAPSVVYLRAEDSNHRLKSTATGFAIADGLFLTAAHAVDSDDQFSIDTAKGERIPITIIAKDEDSDIAIVKATKTPQHKLPALELAESDHVKPSETVYCLGHPRGLKPIYLSKGSVVGTETVRKRKIQVLDAMRAVGKNNEADKVRSILVQQLIDESDGKAPSYWHRKELMVNMHTEKGNSGSPLIDLNGRVVGLLCDGFEGQTKIGLSTTISGFAPSVRIKSVLNKHGYLNKH